MASIALHHPHDDVRQLIEHTLGRLGHVTVLAGAEREAHLLIVEPASSADLEAATRLRESCPDLPIVCLSIVPAFGRALELAPAAYLVKPFTVAALRATVDEALAAA
jgi:CheY-like chemotaxis protein